MGFIWFVISIGSHPDSALDVSPRGFAPVRLALAARTAARTSANVSDRVDLGLGPVKSAYDVRSALFFRLRGDEAALRLARPHTVDDGTATAAWSLPPLRVCVRADGKIVGAIADDGTARAATDRVIESKAAVLWLISERVAHNYGHFMSALVTLFAAMHDAQFVRPARALLDGAPALAAAGRWTVAPDLTLIVDPLGYARPGKAGMFPRFVEQLRTLFPRVEFLAAPAAATGANRTTSPLCTRLPRAVFGSGALGMGSVWDFFADAGLRARGRHRTTRAWRAGSLVPLFQAYAFERFGVPPLGVRPLDDGRAALAALDAIISRASRGVAAVNGAASASGGMASSDQRPVKLLVFEHRTATTDSGKELAPRSLTNMPDLIAVVEQLSSASTAYRLVPLVVSLGALPVRDVPAVVAAADALIGVEGSGLANAIWLRPGAALITVKPYPLCESDAYTADASQFLADAADKRSISAPHATNQMFGLYGSFEKLALALLQPVHIVPICVPREHVVYDFERTTATRIELRKKHTNEHGLPLLDHTSYASRSLLMRYVWYINSVSSLALPTAAFRSALHALHTIWTADRGD